jgi:hypothetical protein
MIAIDTSSWIAYLSGDSGEDVDEVDQLLDSGGAVVPAVVITELFSDPKLSPAILALLEKAHVLEVSDGFWERAGKLRARLLSAGRKAALADALIAQSCLDHGVPLLTRDRDFRHFRSFGLRLVPEVH